MDVKARIYRMPILISLMTNGLICMPNNSIVLSGPKRDDGKSDQRWDERQDRREAEQKFIGACRERYLP